jgi:hypothetical protein
MKAIVLLLLMAVSALGAQLHYVTYGFAPVKNAEGYYIYIGKYHHPPAVIVKTQTNAVKVALPSGKYNFSYSSYNDAGTSRKSRGVIITVP